ncbi:hypothetical protein AVEN_220828-1 [Araneus ventricosus]|uniref:DDE-1 domain-containing protein n=1 Tax=Araneus ventricosus TaxID=182803 RepID=A0A4Y2FP96_ARAVE|nr:hypothetical protein AVEN_220828-1 [Araneus ventricosus]
MEEDANPHPALIQPMDQNVIQNIKLLYRKLLLTNILHDSVHNENLVKTLKNVNLKDVMFNLANCWALVSTLLINKSWKNLLPNFIDSEVEENVQTEKFSLHHSLTNYKTRTRCLKLKPSNALLRLMTVCLKMKF